MDDTTQFNFYDTLRVRFADTDPQGHVFFSNYYTFFDEARAQYMHAIGFPGQALGNLGIDLIYTHSECDYHARTFTEEYIKVFARVGKIGNSSLTFEFAIRKSHRDELVAYGKIVAVSIDQHTKKPVRVPSGLREAIARFEST